VRSLRGISMVERLWDPLGSSGVPQGVLRRIPQGGFPWRIPQGLTLVNSLDGSSWALGISPGTPPRGYAVSPPLSKGSFAPTVVTRGLFPLLAARV
jgi:hypothetical protein